jgi:Glycosyl transferases group 1
MPFILMKNRLYLLIKKQIYAAIAHAKCVILQKKPLETKKVLVISYYWPPAGGPGVQRWLKMCKYLPDFGWQPTVFVPENPSYPIIDEALQQEVSPDLNIIKQKIFEPYALAEKLHGKNKKFKAGQFDVGQKQGLLSRIFIWIRGNFFIPDARKFWIKPSIKRLKKYLDEHPHDIVVSSGPPHSLHLIAMALKAEFPHMKWVADFRDPWTEISYHSQLKLSPRAAKKHLDLEQQVFDKADICLATSYTDAQNFAKKNAKALTLTNGFDASDFKAKIAENKQFVLAYVGVLEQLRNPQILWQALNDLMLEHEDFAQDFECHFVGRLDDEILKDLAGTALQKKLIHHGYVPHQKAIAHMQSANFLLLTNFPTAQYQGIIPGKLFEYLACQRPILSFGPEKSDVAQILARTQAGAHFAYTQKAKLKAYLLQQYRAWQDQKPFEMNLSAIKSFERQQLSQDLANIMNTLTSS